LISNFKVGSDQTRFGSFEFIGGLELSSPSSMLGAMSAIRLSADRQRFLGVMDTGFWYAGRFERGPNGELTGIAEFLGRADAGCGRRVFGREVARRCRRPGGAR
jgi:hypothetical protein